MRRPEAAVGEVLLRAGLVTEDELRELLESQAAPMPVLSLAYAFGLAQEEPLARALSHRAGIPAVVLDRSAISLALLDGVAAEVALLHRVLPLYEDERHLFVAAEDPDGIRDVMREIEFVRGKSVVPHIALMVTLRRTLSACRRLRAAGESMWCGGEVDQLTVPPSGTVVVVAEPITAPPGSAEARAHDVVIEDVTKVELDDILVFEDAAAADGPTSVDTATERSEKARVGLLAAGTAVPPAGDPALETPVTSDGSVVPPVAALSWVHHLQRDSSIEVIDLDAADGPSYRPLHGGRPHVLVVDDDVASANLLVKELAPLGFRVDAAISGYDAIARVVNEPPDVLLVDMMLPEVDGFQICRAVKQSRKYRRIGVVLISAVIDSGRVTDEVIRQSGADAYFEKPIHVEPIVERLHALLAPRGSGAHATAEAHFQQAIALYRRGDVDGGVAELRLGIEVDPRSAKHHFVLANFLHKKALIYEAIDEYEATLELRPDYFPALTRLAYLYYRQGFVAKAIETWRRSLPLCPDPDLRYNIEVFMRKLIADMTQD